MFNSRPASPTPIENGAAHGGPAGERSGVGGCGSCAVLSLPSALRFAALEVRHDGFLHLHQVLQIPRTWIIRI